MDPNQDLSADEFSLSGLGSNDIFPVPPDFKDSFDITPLDISQKSETEFAKQTLNMWTSEEDSQLRKAVEQFGTSKWRAIGSCIPSRTAKQCREHWFNVLAPEIKKGAFQEWEDRILLIKQSEIGNKWSTIATHLPGRSSGQIKNRWHSYLSHLPQSEKKKIMLGIYDQRRIQKMINQMVRKGTI